jgi:hypothetical protein
MRSVPDVAFVKSNLVARQHEPELILKTVTTMMFRLVPDVETHRFSDTTLSGLVDPKGSANPG